MAKLVSLKEYKTRNCREEAIELVNQGYLAKAIVHLEKELNDPFDSEKNFTFELIKNLTFQGEIRSKCHMISLINLI